MGLRRGPDREAGHHAQRDDQKHPGAEGKPSIDRRPFADVRAERAEDRDRGEDVIAGVVHRAREPAAKQGVSARLCGGQSRESAVPDNRCCAEGERRQHEQRHRDGKCRHHALQARQRTGQHQCREQQAAKPVRDREDLLQQRTDTRAHDRHECEEEQALQHHDQRVQPRRAPRHDQFVRAGQARALRHAQTEHAEDV